MSFAKRPVPVVGVNAHGHATDIAMIPYQELDSFLSELSGDFDFGIGEMEVSGFELGKLKAKGKLQIKASVKPGKYKAVVPHSAKKAPAKVSAKVSAKGSAKRAPVAKKPPGKHAVAKHRKQGKKVAIVARQKPKTASERPLSVNEVYTNLKKQGKIINLMKAQRDATAEHRALESQDAFRGNVLRLLNAIDKKVCAATPGTSDNFRARYGRLKLATGAG